MRRVLKMARGPLRGENMSKRYVIQVLDTVTDENAKDVYDVATSEQGEPVTAWFNLQHPKGGNWLTRSQTTALNDAVTLAVHGETRPLRIGESKPVYAVTVLPELDVAEAVALAKQIGLDMAAEAEANGVSLVEVLDPSYESDDVFADEDEDTTECDRCGALDDQNCDCVASDDDDDDDSLDPGETSSDK